MAHRRDSSVYIMNEDLRAFELTAKKLLCGGVAGTSGIALGQPLDLVKVRLQTEPGLYSSSYQCLVQTIKNEGFSSLYKGMMAPLCAQFFQNGLIFAGESVALGYLQPNVNFDADMDNRTVMNVFLAGSFGGLLQCLVLVPADLVKCKMQVDHGGPNKKGLYTGTLDCLSKVYNSEGVKGLYKGFGVTTVREVPAFGVYFFVYRYSLQVLNTLFSGSSFEVQSSPPLSSGKVVTKPGLSTLIAGGLAGSGSWICIYPFDVIKSNVQTATAAVTPVGGIAVKPLTGFGTAKHLYKLHGASVFTRGMGITVARAFPVNALVFYMHETLKNLIL
jgi:solute carrier family 25 carnitine/acylcarnitine transporter 20/29